MIRLDASALTILPTLTERQQRIVRLRLDGLTPGRIATALGINRGAVSRTLGRVLQLAPPDPRVGTTTARPARAGIAHRPTKMGKPIDAAWYERQVAYVRSLEHDPGHQGAYLRGIAMCQGQDVADEVERRADAS